MTGSRPILPRFASEDLRDHADEGRVDRVWDRLERNLQTGGAAKRRSSLRWTTAVGIAASWAIGFGFGAHVMQQPAEAPEIKSLPLSDSQSCEVLAATDQSRSYPLPGGGSVELGPGSIVDMVGQDSEGLTLRLIRGDASLKTRSAEGTVRTTQVALQVGNARVTTSAGSVWVKLDGDQAEVEVFDGSASVVSPHSDEGAQLVLGPRQRRTVQVRAITARQEPVSEIPRRYVADLVEDQPSDEEGKESQEPEPSEEPSSDEWRKLCASYQTKNAAPDYLHLRKIIDETGGGSKAIHTARSAQELNCIYSAYRGKGGDVEMQRHALIRIVDKFSGSADFQDEMAAYELGRMQENSSPEEAEKYYALVRDGSFASRALCKRIKLKAAEGDVDAVTNMAQEYRQRWPDGDCIDKLDRFIGTSKAKAQLRAEEEKAKGEPPPEEETDEYEADLQQPTAPSDKPESKEP